ncbi:type IV pilus assembly protein PilN [Sinobacterium caligoides]|uniref:Type IV pilus assembly protein PilN n=1 Tax=Sinobacterium caligoides TaxID=933926 RepID=A0A3N2DQ58_9GAMM|nr:PilN domain-containing protein [Sinobacterium caligoides]ROS01956.1 type IV pilus assembly protein PilN [Sinobacterium caligoides]
MATINLLPWREERREELKKEFLVCCVLSIVAAGLLLTVYYSFVNNALTSQQARNGYIERHISDLDVQVKEIKELKKKRQQMLDRMKVVQDLQGTRPYIVHVFDELVRSTPDGLYFGEVTAKGELISVEGVAESSQRVSSLMRALEKSEWFKDPNLTEVQANRAFGEQGSNFKMTFRLELPGQEDGEDT